MKSENELFTGAFYKKREPVVLGYLIDNIMNDDDELIEKRIELRQKLKSKLLTLSPSRHIFDSFNNFIPNSRDLDFIEKQGLDCVINYLINNNSIESN